jgi:SAM-dependent methyltransferase
LCPQTVEEFGGYRIRTRHVDVAGERFLLIGPDQYESLLDDPRVAARFARDEYMPYWAEFWPAASLLAEAVAAWGPPADQAAPPRVLEVGCGLGLVSLVALRLGYAVVASDYDQDALAFVAESARRNGLPQPLTRYVDWRETYVDLRCDRIVAAEVLYEDRNLRPVAEFVRNHLVDNGFALICDRNRSTADTFPEVAGACGLTVAVTSAKLPGEKGEPDIAGRIFRLQRAL